MRRTVRSVTAGAAATAALSIGAGAAAQDAVQWRVEDGGNGHWYRVIVEPSGLSLLQALQRAAASGAHLFTGCNSEFDFAVSNTTALDPSCWQAWGNHQLGPWIGLVRTSEGFTWMTSDANCDFDRWDVSGGQPDDQGESAVMLYSTNSKVTPHCHDVGPDRLTQSALLEWSADCNGDGIVDYGQILLGQLSDADSNGVPDVCEAPSGQALIVDSALDFSAAQGQDGWFYEFDRGLGTQVLPMPHVVEVGDQIIGTVWCTRPVFGYGGSYCSVGAEWMHPSTPSACSSAEAGLERPRRRWAADRPVTGTLVLTGRFANYDGTTSQLQVYVDGKLALAIDSSPDATLAEPALIEASIHIDRAISIELVHEPLDGSCHADGVWCVARIFGADCDADGVADYLQIGNGDAVDADSDGLPDVCETDPCPGDVNESGVVNAVDLAAVLSAWGTDGGKFPRADVNRDGTVDALDLAQVLSDWGPCPD